jgi:hypothetical protein
LTLSKKCGQEPMPLFVCIAIFQSAQPAVKGDNHMGGRGGGAKAQVILGSAFKFQIMMLSQNFKKIQLLY